jgi:uroporphyrinogen III methyltransferase/synthase
MRGAKLLDRADVVIYDFLANPRLLKLAPRAEVIYVGKKAGQHSMPQDQINALLVEQAAAGKQVVRLKGGDPYVFGRGAEECQALAAAGIPFEVVPGVTSAVAAAAYAGIPATHRDFNSTFTLVTGHEKEDEPSDIAWPVLAKLPCLAFYMGVKALPNICRKLIENGMDPQMPAAAISWGTLPRQRVVTATVATLADKVREASLETPAIAIVGKVVTFRNLLDWFGRRPLLGKRIVVTRTRLQASELSERLEEFGAEVIEAPTIEIAPPSDYAPIDTALANAADYDWIVFTSANGASAVKERLWATGKDPRVFGRAKIAVIGQATADAVKTELCLQVDCCPKRFIAEALAKELINAGEAKGKRFLLLRADLGRPELVDMLTAAGAKVDDVSVYQTRPTAQLPAEIAEGLAARNIDWITFTSSSTARNFTALLGPNYRKQLTGVKLASIGPITTKTLLELGLEPSVEAETSDIPGLAAAMANQS